jgi:hypothetical protein
MLLSALTYLAEGIAYSENGKVSIEFNGYTKTEYIHDRVAVYFPFKNIKKEINHQYAFNNSNQFNSLLFMCRVNSHKVNYRHSTV